MIQIYNKPTISSLKICLLFIINTDFNIFVSPTNSYFCVVLDAPESVKHFKKCRKSLLIFHYDIVQTDVVDAKF